MHGRLLAILAVAIVAVGAFAFSRAPVALSPASAGARSARTGSAASRRTGTSTSPSTARSSSRSATPASPLALPLSGASKFAPVPPIRVTVFHDGTEETVDEVSQVVIFTHENRVATVELTKADGEVVEFRSQNAPETP